MNQPGPEDRQLLEREAIGFYESVVDVGGIPADDPRIVDGAPERAAFDLLVRLELLTLDDRAQRYVVVDPSVVASRVVSPLGQQGAALIAESSAWARSFATLTQTWRRSPQATQGPFTEIHGLAAINRFLAGLVSEAHTELLTAQPQTGRDPARLAAAMQRDTAALERGVTLRTLYQHAARRSSHTAKYVTEVTQRGAEVRTLDEFFDRIIVVDREVAIIPSTQSNVALAVREPSLVAYFVSMFERSWERARPFANRERSTVREVAAEQRAMTIRMLIEGHADAASAKRLGVSPRSYAGYVAELKEEFDCQTRFQLGYEMGKQGVSGRESPRDT
ncbi:LuxR family transcriptional regulator [Nocardioides sp.]|uniref:LuxR family transcriptional regulator n=1 Tax=Nocardioides sp. TaxID=35761 RepID=UPI002732A22C|nr:LuxR family transcriptional regulator [Nocardioides sp.]MDP3893474.1 LuxR family transcriptional regulator [Nocardioides sp.]